MYQRMNLHSLLPKRTQKLTPYSSGKSEFSGKARIYLNTNESPFDIFQDPGAVIPNMPDFVSGLNRYPDPYQKDLKSSIARFKNISPDQIFLSNGSDEVIDILIRSFCETGDQIVTMTPTFGMYAVASQMNEITVVDVPLIQESWQMDMDTLQQKISAKTKIIFVCSPNNPTGNLLKTKDICTLIKTFHGIVVIDQAYIDFSDEADMYAQFMKYENVVILQTFSKAYSLAGLRLGMTFASITVIQILNKYKMPYNLNVLTQKLAETALDNINIIQKNIDQIKHNKQIFIEKLKKIAAVKKIYPSDANFVLMRFYDSAKAYQTLLKNGIAVRDFSQKPNLENCLRISIGTEFENNQVIDILNTLPS